MPRVHDVVSVLETLYPLRYAENWDHPGLIVGNLAAPVMRIAFAADPTMAVIDEALEYGADLLVCHHPLLFRAAHEVSGLGIHGHIVRRLHEAGCALWVGHTNADAAFRGVAHAAAQAFGLTQLRPLVPIDDPQSAHAVGLGRVGVLPESMSLREFAQRVAREVPPTALGVQVCGELDMSVRTVAVLPGSGDSLMDEVRASGADVYVTSDLRHHPVTDAIEQARYEAWLRAQGVPVGGGDIADAAPRPAFINTAHSAIESMWFRYAVQDVPQAVMNRYGERPEVRWITRNTDPWALHIAQ